ncbi:MAG: methanethiol S-methyltransferase [Planctomycetota bacterium]|jgi:protein-S-isoprenylcysteine O-methyltransferase Ste14
MSRILVFAYGLLVYLLFLPTFLYAAGFITGLGVPKTVDDGAAGAIWTAILVNVGMLSVFAIQHTIMARTTFKTWWARIVPPAAERSTFVLITCLILGALFWQWRPIDAVIWHVEAQWARIALQATAFLGFGIVLYSTFLIDHFDLFGMRQVTLNLLGRDYRNKPFSNRSLYKYVRHPLMLGFVIAFWATPDMTGGHLLFAAVTTVYILVGVHIEERTLIGHLGDDYRHYQKTTPMLIPFTKRSAPAVIAPEIPAEIRTS